MKSAEGNRGFLICRASISTIWRGCRRAGESLNERFCMSWLSKKVVMKGHAGLQVLDGMQNQKGRLSGGMYG